MVSVKVFFAHEGEDALCLDKNRKEECLELWACVTVLVAKGIWHKITARAELAVSHATRQDAEMQVRK